MEQITIKAIWLNDTKKDGTPYLDKSQRPYKGVKIITTDNRQLWCNGYQGSPVLNWKVGETHEVDIWEGQNGFLSLRIPNRSTPVPTNLQAQVAGLERALLLLKDRVAELEAAQDGPEDTPF